MRAPSQTCNNQRHGWFAPSSAFARKRLVAAGSCLREGSRGCWWHRAGEWPRSRQDIIEAFVSRRERGPVVTRTERSSEGRNRNSSFTGHTNEVALIGEKSIHRLCLNSPI